MFEFTEEIWQGMDEGFDPPHAFARLEGQPCSCPSRYYGGDCEHTAETDEEIEAMHAIDSVVEATIAYEVAIDDFYAATYELQSDPHFAGNMDAALTAKIDAGANFWQVLDDAGVIDMQDPADVAATILAIKSYSDAVYGTR